MHIFKRGNVFWFELMFEGRRIQKSTKSKNHRTAGQVASAYHVALIKGEVGIVERKTVPLFAPAMKTFLEWSVQEHSAHPMTAARYRVSSLPLLRFFRGMELDRITPEDVENYKVTRSREKSPQSKQRLRPATVNRELACLRRLFSFTMKSFPALRNPVSQVKFLDEDNLQTRVLTWTEQERYLSHASPTLADVATLILETGMRPGEVFELKQRTIDLQAGYLRIPKSKTPAGRRRIELTETARAVLARRIDEAGDGYLFPCERDPSRPLPAVHAAHVRALGESGLEPFRLYDLRHTWATRAAQAGIDLVTLAAMMGHSRIQMVLRYAHPTQNHQASAMQRLVEHNKTQWQLEKQRVEAEELARAKKRLAIVPTRRSRTA